jgi:hypothetical protein
MHVFLHVALIVAGYSLMAGFAWLFGVYLPLRDRRGDDEDDLRPATV